MAALKFAQTIRKISTSVPLQNGLVSLPVQVFGIEGRYAHALYSAATKGEELERIDKEINKLKDLIKVDIKLKEFLDNPTYKKIQKKDVLEKALKKQEYSELIVNLFGAMAENGRLKNLSGILRSFTDIMRAHRGEVHCTVTTAKLLDSASERNLTSTLQLFLKPGQTLITEKKVDPSIVGGMIVNLGDRYADMSMATKIKTYTDLMKQAI